MVNHLKMLIGKEFRFHTIFPQRMTICFLLLNRYETIPFLRSKEKIILYSSVNNFFFCSGATISQKLSYTFIYNRTLNTVI